MSSSAKSKPELWGTCPPPDSFITSNHANKVIQQNESDFPSPHINNSRMCLIIVSSHSTVMLHTQYNVTLKEVVWHHVTSLLKIAQICPEVNLIAT